MTATTRAKESTAPPPQPVRPDAFVSYSRADQAFVDAVVGALDARGKELFIDREDIRKSEDWWKRIVVGIGSAKCVVAVLSPDFAASATCGKEIAQALGQNKRLVPIVCRDVEPNTLPEGVAALNFIFARETDDFDAAIDDLERAIGLDLEWLDFHARLTVRATEWIRANRDSSLLLRRSDLAAAEERLGQQGAHSEALTDEQVKYILASRGAERRRRGITFGAVLFALAVAIVLAVLAWLARNEAIEQSAQSRSRELATTSADRIDEDPELSLLLALEAFKSAETPEAVGAVRQALARSHVRLRLKSPPGGAVVRTAVAARGQRLVASDGDSTELADARTGREVRALPGAGAAVSQNRVFTTDGRSVKVFDAATGRDLETLPAPHLRISAVQPVGGDAWVAAAAQTRSGSERVVVWHSGAPQPAFILHGTFMAASARRPLIAVSGVSRLRLLRLTPKGTETVDDITQATGWVGGALDASGRRFAGLAGSGDVIVGDLTRGTWRRAPLVSELILPGFEVTLAFDASGSRLAIAPRPYFGESGGGSSVIGSTEAMIVDARSGETVAKLRGHGSLLGGIAFAPDGHRVVTCSDDGTARVWDVAKGTQLVVLSGHDGPVRSCTFVTRDRVMTGGDDKTARVWDVSTLRPIRRATGDGAVIGDGGQVIALANKRGATTILDASTGATKAQFKRLAVDDIASLRVDDHGRTLAINPVIDENTAIWSVSKRQRIVALKGATLAVSHDGGHALVDRYGHGTMVDTRDVKASKTVKWDEQPVTGIFSPHDRVVVTLVGDVRTTAGEGPPRVWDTRTGRLLKTLGDEPRVYAGAFTPDGRHFATGGEEGVIRIWDVKTGHRVQQLPPQGGRVVALAYDRSGTSLAAAIRGNRAFVWRLDAPGTPLRLSHPQNVVDIAFSPRGTLVVTSSDTGAARVWDRSSGRLVLTLPPRTGGNAAARFTADGRSVMVSGVPELATVVSTYPCDECPEPGDLVALAHSRTTRKPTPSERRVYLHER